jgi:hypothetical protein
MDGEIIFSKWHCYSAENDTEAASVWSLILLMSIDLVVIWESVCFRTFLSRTGRARRGIARILNVT